MSDQHMLNFRRTDLITITTALARAARIKGTTDEQKREYKRVEEKILRKFKVIPSPQNE